MYAKLLKKNQILDAGLDCFYNCGYNGTGVKDIVDAAGVPKGSFYNYFESKEQFAIEALEKFASQESAELREALLNSEGSGAERLFNFMDSRIEMAMGQEMFSGCLMGNMCQELAVSCESVREKLATLIDEHIKIVAEVISAGQKDGSLKAALDPHETAEFLFASAQGAMLKMKADRSRRAFDLFLKHAEVILKP